MLLNKVASWRLATLRNKDIGMGYGTLWMGCGTLVSLDFHNLPSLYPSSFCRNDIYTCFTNFFMGQAP